MKYPGYTDVIQKAMDLSTVYDLLNKRSYNTYKEILEDIRLCFSNAITFWGRGDDENPIVVENAKKSSVYFEDVWAQASLTIFEYTQREAILRKILNQQKAAARAEQRSDQSQALRFDPPSVANRESRAELLGCLATEFTALITAAAGGRYSSK